MNNRVSRTIKLFYNPDVDPKLAFNRLFTRIFVSNNFPDKCFQSFPTKLKQLLLIENTQRLWSHLRLDGIEWNGISPSTDRFTADRLRLSLDH